jgi:hypothetical protein
MTPQIPIQTPISFSQAYLTLARLGQTLPTVQFRLHSINHNIPQVLASAEQRGLVDNLAFAASSSIAVIAPLLEFFVSRPQ